LYGGSSPSNPSKKWGKDADAQAKIHPCGDKANGPNFKHFVLGAQRQLEAQIWIVNRLGIKVCGVLILGATENFDWIAFEGFRRSDAHTLKFKDQRSVYCFGDDWKFFHCIFERNSAINKEISEMAFEMNCFEIEPGNAHYGEESGG